MASTRLRPYAASSEVVGNWLQVYRDPKAHWDLYHLAEELTDLEDASCLWRTRRVITMERVIGLKHGARGADGLS